MSTPPTAKRREIRLGITWRNLIVILTLVGLFTFGLCVLLATMLHTNGPLAGFAVAMPVVSLVYMALWSFSTWEGYDDDTWFNSRW